MNDYYYEKCGKKMIDTIIKFWPKNIQVFIYYEGSKMPKNLKNINFLNFEKLYNFIFFEKKFSELNFLNGKKKSWDYDAIKFSKKVFSILEMADKFKKNNFLIWMDSDILTYKKITFKHLENFVNKKKFLSYLGREYCYDNIRKRPFHTETGFMIFNLSHKKSEKFFSELKKTYLTGKIFYFYEHHDCIAIDYVRKNILEKHEELNIPLINNNIKCFDDLTFIFENTGLGKFMKHFKGHK